MPYVVAVAGGIASGKTAATDWFASQGVPVADADVVSRELTGPDGRALPEIARLFGEEFLGPEGLRRAPMRDLVFSHPEERRRLEALLHPMIQEEIRTRLSSFDAPWALFAIPLLRRGSPWERLCARVLVIDVPESVQIARLHARSGIGGEQARQILAAQPSRRERLCAAHDVVVNAGTLEELHAALERLLPVYDRLAREAASGTVPCP